MKDIRQKYCEKKYKTAELKILKIINKIEQLNLSNSYVSKLNVRGKNKWRVNFAIKKPKLYGLTLVLISAIIFCAWSVYSEISSESCILINPSLSKFMFRPPEDCSMCVGVDGVVRLSNLSARQFEDQYAYRSTPVIVTDAMSEWKAVETFNFNFFANFYREGKLGTQINDCFYFAYKSGLNSLNEVFSMEEKRANLSGDPWYVGWSTCYDEETRVLRSYYNRPYFLPETAESDMVDWIFMGGPGQGAHMHVDSVRHMSWQAQILGRKQWVLAPPPECFYQCGWITFTVSPGEILVVDTNRWYHKTNVLPGDISITIGAEYD